MINDYIQVKECTFKGEYYSVRDNGAVCRHARANKPLRKKYDNIWTFGKQNRKTGYMEIASVRIHRIVATAFHGESPTKEHVVDHIDTNKCNNRPENLRWVTRLENVLLNPITVKRIELSCGCSIEEFLEDPSKYRDKFHEPNYQWMCTVSKQEANISREKLLAWAESDKTISGGSLGEWIYNRNQFESYIKKEPDYSESLTVNAKQYNWKTPSEFPLCPNEDSLNSIEKYSSNLKIGDVFSRNQYSEAIIEDFAISKNKEILWLKCINSNENAMKRWSLVKITINNEIFIHENLGSFFEEIGARKEFLLEQGKEWNGGTTFDELT